MGHAHYLTFSCYKRQWLFRDTFLCESFLEHLAQARQYHQFKLWAFVIMPNHVHLILRPDELTSITTILHSVKRPFSYLALGYLRAEHSLLADKLKREKSSGVTAWRFWQHGGGYDRNIFNIKALKEKIDYIHNNPVRAGLIREPVDWRWSSAKFWISGEKGDVDLDEIEVF